MTLSDIINVEKQLAFYGAYHANKVNVLIHIICVPMIVWSFQALVAPLHVPSFLPAYHHIFNDYMVFDVNYATIMGVVYLAYYFLLEPVAALLYTPQMIVTVLTATAFSQKSGYIPQAIAVHAFSWIAQFAGHGFAEGRAPALLDNLLGAVVLAPFFVHLEILFHIGYRPVMQKRINNAIGQEITKIRKADGDKRRKAQ
ncbi:hypothetical protein CVT25_008723 [Psilocybe cyanescens]|uniref:DUF962-domain-containing protein n=1 Tax=Psilocybe cyanescens TaxID=93625 RepID=A0A409XNK4_PSICY|nr:hypothetical protein CVT25_008723 [Psilocybe cyanescens]